MLQNKEICLPLKMKGMIIMTIFLKFLTLILVISTFSSCTSLMALTGSEKANAELHERIYEESKIYCAVENTYTGECVKWKRID